MTDFDIDIETGPGGAVPDAASHKIYMLDVGRQKYGDAILVVFGNTRILIDGSHPGDEEASAVGRSIPDQLEAILGPPPFRIDLLVVTHCHSDHIGCLPAMVLGNTLRTKWALLADPGLGWGEIGGVDNDALMATLDAGERRLAAALREESRADLDDDNLELFLDSAEKLRGDYDAMIQRLKDDLEEGRLILFDGENADPIEAAFQNVGLKILGPTPEHLRKCAEVIADESGDRGGIVHDFVSTAVTVSEDGEEAEVDAGPIEELTAYRQLVDSLATDASSEGAAINDQSIVLTVEHAGKRVLLTGDMQFAGGVSEVNAEIADLRDKVEQSAPYAFVKLAHHAAANGLSEKTLADYGETVNFGISTGILGTDHPNPKVLTLLKSVAQDKPISVSRTDRNGLVTIDLDANPPKMTKTRGELNDFKPKRKKPPTRPDRPERREAVRSAEGSGRSISAETRLQSPKMPLPPNDMVTVVAYVPHRKTNVRLDIRVDPDEGLAEVSRGPIEDPSRSGRTRTTGGDAGPMPTLSLAAGREVPRLLFATRANELIDRIGVGEANHVLQQLRENGHLVLDNVPGGADAQVAAEFVRKSVADAGDIAGVVLLGGYDIIPSLRVDAVDNDIRDDVHLAGDPDRFIVWSDDIYTDSDGDLLPELPISRIPDGKSKDLVFAALGAERKRTSGKKTGVRNVKRPFADDVWKTIAGNGKLLRSEPAVFDQQPAIELGGDLIYLMLHGSATDGTRFAGEETVGNKEAVNLGNVPASLKTVVLCGCCWGALTVGTPAYSAGTNTPLRPRSADSSLALRFLQAGAMAFVGCTGAHWSPKAKATQGAGGPLHLAFIAQLQDGRRPAEALMNAKIAYAGNIPHQLDGADGIAIETKTLAQFTCLGLGW